MEEITYLDLRTTEWGSYSLESYYSNTITLGSLILTPNICASIGLCAPVISADVSVQSSTIESTHPHIDEC